MTYDEKPAERGLNGLPDVQSFGGCEHPEATPSRRSAQETARAAEVASRRHHLIGRRCGGAIARTELALAEHYGRVARQHMGGAQ
ncbi:hypothetical protein [uncultured Phenylobacterium sp.]|uniref:hypothetical protein n=1 Tax=uncultured Phenylobacterium sp. TaxID=349273 RepID=UPI0025D0B798|nr:hypothetical protein [uncultured Phenylobacterium sp.]